MIRTIQIRFLRNVGLLCVVVSAFVSSCTDQGRDSEREIMPGECITVEKQADLENGIRGQVKFMGEPERLSSVNEKMSEYSIPALSLAVINNGQIEWTAIYKNEDFPEVKNLDCASIFQAASLSKPVTFMAALRMHAAGEIDLDKNIQQYLNDFELPDGKQTAEHPVTFRNLFSHTSGITPGGYQGYAKDVTMPADLDVVRGATGVNSPPVEVITTPGERLAYSGGGYTLAELALQDIFNEQFSDIMETWILQPAGMTNSEFTQPLPDSAAVHVAKGYTYSGQVLEGGWRNHPEQAAAGLWSNATDMAKFLIEIYKAYQGQSSIFSQSTIETIIGQERDGHVYGFILNRSGDDISITHYGGNSGYRTGMTISLTTGKGLVYLTNSDNGGALGNELLLSASQIYNWQHFKQTEVERKQIDPEILMELSGEYKWNNQIDLTITFDENSEQISLIFPNGDEYELTPVSGEELDFIHPNTGVQISFIKDDLRTFRLYGESAVKL